MMRRPHRPSEVQRPSRDQGCRRLSTAVNGTRYRRDVAHPSRENGAIHAVLQAYRDVPFQAPSCLRAGAMSWKSREKKRRYKLMEQKAIAKAKARRNAATAHGWYLVHNDKDTCCARCGVVLRRDVEAVYRHKPREIRCLPCGRSHADSKDFRPSTRWELRRAEEARKRSERTRAKWAKAA